MKAEVANALPEHPGGAPNGLDAPENPRLVFERAFWLVFAASFALNMAANLFVLFPLWVVELGGNASIIGAIIGTGSLAALAARPGVGALIDRRGRKWTALWFLVLDAIAISLYFPIHSIGLPIFLVRAIHGAIEGTARVALFAMVYEMLPRGREGEAMATFSLCGMVPGAIAPLVGEQLIRSLGFTVFFALAIALIVASAIVVSFVVEQPHPAHASGDSPGGRSYRSLLTDRALMPLWIVTLMFSLALASRLSFVAAYAYQEGVQRAGWYFAIYSLMAVGVRLVGGQVMDRMGLNRALAPSLAVLAIGLALLAGTGRFGLLDIAAVIGGIGHGYLYPALSALVIARTPLKSTGRSSSIYSSLYDLGGMAGPYLLGVVAVTFGYGPMFIVSGSIALAGAIYFVIAEPDARLRFRN
ncbi:MAG: MFS transporter [Candidatus Binatus sp.]|uniref:MFS transporter n=1 Tax=Candidatus Binatus sp. TaxID=2811406 RepID=UPI0027174418|nr:MFS transporter [Candidatus Binatus sp.]MDO8433698.1 MFS transporter [Candidatus Binatus sp.]